MMFCKKSLIVFLVLFGISNVFADSKGFKAKLTGIKVNGLSKIVEQAVTAVLPVSVGKEYDFKKNSGEQGSSLIAGEIVLDDPGLTSSMIKSIIAMGYFKRNVSYRFIPDSSGDVSLEVLLEEKALLGNVKFNGNKHFGAEKLSKMVSGQFEDQPIVFFDDFDLSKSAKKIEHAYRADGYLATAVQAEMKDREDSVDLVFNITEGSVTRVAKINFHGCKNVDEGALRGLMYTNENWLLGYATGAGKYDSTMLACDKALIERFYHNKGYARAVVCDVKAKELPSGDLILDYYIDEGKLYTVSRFVLPFDTEVQDKDILSANLLEHGKRYSVEDLERTAKRLEYLFCKKGYLHAACSPSTAFDDVKGSVEIAFDVRKGEKFTVRSIDFFGNFKTRDSVMRRELLFTEASLADRSLIDLTVERLKYLGIFDSVDVQYREVSKGIVDVVFYVKEKKHYNSANFSANFSVGEGGVNEPAFQIDLKRTNFSGLGVDVDMVMRHNGKEVIDAGLNFFNPSVGDRGIGLSNGVYYKKHEYDEGNGLYERVFGTEASLFKTLKSNQNFRNKIFFDAGLEGISYDYPEDYNLKRGAAMEAGFEQYLKTQNISVADFLKQSKQATIKEYVQDVQATKDLRLSQGQRLKKLYQQSLIGEKGNLWFGTKYVLDNLNSRYNPTSGWYVGARGKMFVGLLDSSLAFKAEIDGAFYYPLVRNENLKIDFSLKGRLGFVDSLTSGGDVLKKELYNVGGVLPSGIGMVRGFKFAEAGPGLRVGVGTKTLNIERPYFVGAKRMVTINMELSLPAGGPEDPVFHAFYDIGCGWKGQFDKLALSDASLDQFVVNNSFGLRHSCGVGFKMVKPMPVRVDWGYKLNRMPGESPTEVTLGMHMPF